MSRQLRNIQSARGAAAVLVTPADGDPALFDL
jgi:hypothetical protein